MPLETTRAVPLKAPAGIAGFDEVFMSSEERAENLAANAASLGYDLDGLVAAHHDRGRPPVSVANARAGGA